ncbi:MAG TPA: twin-arginine translocase TatA/TatE family subunit [Aggregatilineales bacterium]|nr:twin-arginine translocase TatA/TatE family subunit [Anaerolineales bacterium]HRE46507.1 twin-arginine translocase TatA/TatE family subunit [Aggregatilineales bacterium]
MQLGPTELIIILVIVVILFGGGRIARLGGELGSAIREFRRGVGDGEKKAQSQLPPNTASTPEELPAAKQPVEQR